MKEKPLKLKLEMKITGMHCDSCTTTVTQVLKDVDGVEEIQIDSWASGNAFLLLSKEVQDDELITKVENSGYKAKIKKKEIISNSSILGNFEEEVDYDIIVIGTGGGGMASAIKAAELGASVCIIEKGTIGGTCVNIGCVPSKTLIRAAESKYKADNNPFVGVSTYTSKVDWKGIIQQKDDLILQLRKEKYIDVLQSYGKSITLLKGTATIVDKGKVRVNDDKTLTAKRIIIATGAKPRILPIFKEKKVDFLTSTTAMELEKLPKSLVVIGGRGIALELGQTFARLGSKVTLIQRSSRIIPTHEPEISEALIDYLRKEGLTVITGTKIIDVKQKNKVKKILLKVGTQQMEVEGEEILLAVGRSPNTKGLGLKETGINLDEDSFIETDEYLQTSVEGIYAVGDVTTLLKFVYVAASSGGIAAQNAVLGNKKRFDTTIVPSVIFTDPQIAKIGLTEKEAKKHGYDVKTSLLPLKHVPRALAAHNIRGLIKLIADKNSDRLLGAHILAAEAGEVVESAALIIYFGEKYGIKIQEITETMFPYLVQVEGLKLAMLGFNKDVSKLSCCAG
ncbi:MAG: mercury(II) reductase [Candidatus Heimdallarchaeaceae archaeon]